MGKSRCITLIFVFLVFLSVTFLCEASRVPPKPPSSIPNIFYGVSRFSPPSGANVSPKLQGGALPRDTNNENMAMNIAMAPYD